MSAVLKIDYDLKDKDGKFLWKQILISWILCTEFTQKYVGLASSVKILGDLNVLIDSWSW